MIVFNSVSKETHAINLISDNFYKYCPLSCTLLNGKSLLSNEFGEKFPQTALFNCCCNSYYYNSRIEKLHHCNILINWTTALAALYAARDPNLVYAFSHDCFPAKSDSPLNAITGKPFDKVVWKNYHSILVISIYRISNYQILYIYIYIYIKKSICKWYKLNTSFITGSI